MIWSERPGSLVMRIATLLRLLGQVYCLRSMILGFNSLNTAYKNFIGDYVGFGKEPGMAVRPRSYDMPTLVVESGWSESRTQLREDCRMWIAGSPATQIAILVNWNVCTAGRLAGIVEVWALDTNGQPMVSSTHVRILSLAIVHQLY